MKKSKWVKIFKRQLKSNDIRRDQTFWSEQCWRENTNGKHSALTPKQAAHELSRWIKQ